MKIHVVFAYLTLLAASSACQEKYIYTTENNTHSITIKLIKTNESNVFKINQVLNGNTDTETKLLAICNYIEKTDSCIYSYDEQKEGKLTNKQILFDFTRNSYDYYYYNSGLKMHIDRETNTQNPDNIVYIYKFTPLNYFDYAWMPHKVVLSEKYGITEMSMVSHGFSGEGNKTIISSSDYLKFIKRKVKNEEKSTCVF